VRGWRGDGAKKRRVRGKKNRGAGGHFRDEVGGPSEGERSRYKNAARWGARGLGCEEEGAETRFDEWNIIGTGRRARRNIDGQGGARDREPRVKKAGASERAAGGEGGGGVARRRYAYARICAVGNKRSIRVPIVANHTLPLCPRLAADSVRPFYASGQLRRAVPRRVWH
jgi:hypothetical protein